MATTAVSLEFRAGPRPPAVWWSGFSATVVSELKVLVREPSALVFTLAQPLVLLLILDAFNLRTTLPDGKQVPYLDMLLPGLIAFIGMSVGFNSIAFGLMRYKERGILRRVRTTPMPTSAFICAIIISRLVQAFLVTLLTWAIGVYAFGATVSGNVVLLIAVATLGSLAFIALGVFAVALARTEDDMPPMFMLVMMPSVFFSGAFLSRAGLPGWLHTITNGLPLTFLTDATQRISTLGIGVTGLGTDILGLAIWCALGTFLAAWRFRMV